MIMKNIIKNISKGLCVVAVASTLGSCEDFLDKTPISSITPASYLWAEADLAAYTIAYYSFSTHGGWSMGTFNDDAHTDDIIWGATGSTSWWEPGERKVATTDGTYDFSTIRACNYFFETVLPRYEAGELTGNSDNIKHYIGEMYFIRAWTYFAKLRYFGDFPIVTEVLPDDSETLIEASKRFPRNEVARFIIEDLDKAIDLMQDVFSSQNRLNRRAALLLKSRVALFEGSFEKYFKGTAYVPGNSNWVGAAKDYNSAYVSTDIDSEVSYFLNAAMSAAKELADATTLAENTGVKNPDAGQVNGWNPYFEMFGADDMSTYSEVVFWKDYNLSQAQSHSVPYMISIGAQNGYTKGAIDTYLMANGLPIYATGSGYTTDDSSIDKVKANRDGRLQLFVMGESDLCESVYEQECTSAIGDSMWYGQYVRPLEVPNIISGDSQTRDYTGFRNRKMMNYTASYLDNQTSESGLIIFRATEAFLNYMEAQYMRDETLDATSISYWQKLRARAGTSTDYAATIAATDMSQENDWGAYSAGTFVDKTLYNIRRERRMELIGEGRRWDDLKRWRAMDQIENYIVEGCNFWEVMYEDSAFYYWVYNDAKTDSTWTPYFIEAGEEGANIAARTDGYPYLRPYRASTTNNLLYDGYTFSDAYYVYALPTSEFLITSVIEADGSADYSTSPIYQNPGWSTVSNTSSTSVAGF